MSTIVITARKILNAWFSGTNVRIVRPATAKRSKSSCQPLPFSAKGGMGKPSRLQPERHHAADVPQPVVKAAAINEKNV
jgi:hypothetical protein